MADLEKMCHASDIYIDIDDEIISENEDILLENDSNAKLSSTDTEEKTDEVIQTKLKQIWYKIVQSRLKRGLTGSNI